MLKVDLEKEVRRLQEMNAALIQQLDKYEKIQFHIGDIVFSRVVSDAGGMVTGYEVSPNGYIYLVSWDDFGERRHYAIELTQEQCYVIN